MNNEIYSIAKEMFLKEDSLRKIGEELNIDRKKLSLMLRKENIYTDKKIDKETLQKAIEMINKENGITKVASLLGVDRHTLSKELKNMNIRQPEKRHDRNKNNDSIILEKYKNDELSIESIAKELNISTNLVWNCLLEHNAVDKNRTSAIYDYNTDLFKTINTEHEAYWLGFLYADGYVDIYGNSIEFCLKKEDDYHVQSFTKYVSLNKINSYDKSVNGHIQHRIDIHSKELTRNLINCGCINKKSFVKQFPKEVVPDSLMNHFIRGYFDGNGCIHVTKNKFVFSIICASKSFIYDIQEYLINSIKINRTKISKSENCYRFSNAARKDIKLIFDYLYKNSTVFLKRKYNKFKNINN